MSGLTLIYATAALALALVLLAAAGTAVLRSRHMDLWISAYIAQWPRRTWRPRPAQPAETRHVYFCFADHYEPYWGKASQDTARARVQRWLADYPVIAARHRDSDGRVPQHSFFYPEEEYDEIILDGLAGLCKAGFGDVEVHLHHDNDNAAHLRTTLQAFTRRLHERHGLLRRDPQTGQILYCFIHGNWALDNSRPDGRWCGVDDELSVLVETGCRCDMTMPSAPSDTQTGKINSIYFARGHAGCSKSHDHGRDCAVGGWGKDGELLLVQGPLMLNWSDRKLGLMPRIESAEISADAPPTAARVRLWERAGVTVRGAENHVFIKVHTHGAEERAAQALLGGGMDLMWTELERQFRDRPGYQLHYVTAWEMAQTVQRLCQGTGTTKDKA